MFDQVMDRIAGRFSRVEPRTTARAYLPGLLSQVERKNCWQLAEQADLARPGPMQRMLRYARWEADAVRDDIRAYVVEHLGIDGGVLIVDETGFVEKGRASAGVQRQYTGTAGRVENSQVGVFLAYATSRGRALVDRWLYLPEQSWCAYPERRAAPLPGYPTMCSSRPSRVRAWEMIAAALDAGVEARWVTGDEAYGQDPQLRAALEARRTGYVMAVACSTRVWINQSRTPHRHITLAMLALAFLAGVAASTAPERPTDPHSPTRSSEPISLTVPEIRHLLTAVFGPLPLIAARLLRWSDWRRHHQATARRSHYRRRSTDEPTG